MSGLTSYYYYEDRVITPATHQYRVYHADEADKVIADKDAKIFALDAEVVKQKHHAKLFFDERNYAETQLRHQKYKRCVAMASYWIAVSYQCVDDKHRQRAEKRHYKWLKIAEQFKDKEAK